MKIFKLSSKRITRSLDVKADWNKAKKDKAKIEKEKEEILKAQEEIKIGLIKIKTEKRLF